MDRKITKSDRFSLITKVLVENPSKIFTLNYFSDLLGCSKSTISEDIDVIAKNMEKSTQGKIISVTGAAGGVYYLPIFDDKKIVNNINKLCDLLNDTNRIIYGGYLYINDILYSTEWLGLIAKCMISRLASYDFDYVVTIETKGIPLALNIAQLLNKEIVIVRKDARLTEGATIQMNYVTGSKRTIKTMALPIKTIKRGSKAIFVDDFIKAGGTAKGIIDLMKEFDVEVVGCSFILSNKESKEKLIKKYTSLLELEYISDECMKVSANN